MRLAVGELTANLVRLPLVQSARRVKCEPTNTKRGTSPNVCYNEAVPSFNTALKQEEH